MPDKLDEKVQAIFSEIAGADRVKWLRGDVPSRAASRSSSFPGPWSACKGARESSEVCEVSMPFFLLLFLLFLFAAIVGVMYVGIVLLIMIVGGVVVWIITLSSPDKNVDAAQVKWIAEKRKSSALELGSAFALNAGGLGLVVGFFRSCSVESGSNDDGVWLFTVVIFAGVGAIIGGFLGYVFGD